MLKFLYQFREVCGHVFVFWSLYTIFDILFCNCSDSVIVLFYILHFYLNTFCNKRYNIYIGINDHFHFKHVVCYYSAHQTEETHVDKNIFINSYASRMLSRYHNDENIKGIYNFSTNLVCHIQTNLNWFN